MNMVEEFPLLYVCYDKGNFQKLKVKIGFLHFKKNKPYNMYLLFLLLLTCVFADENCSEKVRWKVMSDTAIEYGKELKLMCYVQGCCDPHAMKRWLGPDERNLMLKNGKPIDGAKYDTKIINGTGFFLAIQNLTTNDVNVSYTCSYGFDICKRTLNETEVFKNFVTPDIDNVNEVSPKSQHESSQDQGIVIGVVFGTILPIAAVIAILILLSKFGKLKAARQYCVIKCEKNQDHERAEETELKVLMLPNGPATDPYNHNETSDSKINMNGNYNHQPITVLDRTVDADVKEPMLLKSSPAVHSHIQLKESIHKDQENANQDQCASQASKQIMDNQHLCRSEISVQNDDSLGDTDYKLGTTQLADLDTETKGISSDTNIDDNVDGHLKSIRKPDKSFQFSSSDGEQTKTKKRQCLKRSEYKNIKMRRNSFTQWPEKPFKPTVDEMANAGFFYLGHGTMARCFHCGKKLDFINGMNPNDDECHEIGCIYLNKLKVSNEGAQQSE